MVGLSCESIPLTEDKVSSLHRSHWEPVVLLPSRTLCALPVFYRPLMPSLGSAFKHPVPGSSQHFTSFFRHHPFSCKQPLPFPLCLPSVPHFWSVCVLYMCAGAHVSTHGAQWSMLDVFLDHPLLHSVRVSHLRNPSVRPGWIVNELQQFTCPPLPCRSLRITDACTAPGFYMRSGVLLHLTSQTLYWMSHLSNPTPRI